VNSARIHATLLLALVAIVAARPASAQWSRIEQVPIANIYSVWSSGSVITAGSDTTALVSTDAGATWTQTSTIAPGATAVRAVRLRNGLLYAGAYARGVFVSSDMGASWQSFNQGLSGAFADQQFNISDLLFHGDTLYATTEGAGVWIRDLSSGGTWSRYGALDQATFSEGIDASDTRLFAATGNNGDAYYRDPGDPDWTMTLLLNGTTAAGLAPTSVVWTGSCWLVGTNIGVFRSVTGQEPWTYTDFGLRPLFFTSFALSHGTVWTHFANNQGTGIEYSRDDGLTWQVLDKQPGVFTYAIEAVGDQLYAARVDGLWRRAIATIMGGPGSGGSVGLHFAVLGRRPSQNEVRFEFQLPRSGRVRIDVFDISGRRVAVVVDEPRSAGPNEVRWSMRGLSSGIYLARLSTIGESESAKLVWVK
jgi:hypothetical protein